jgi:hypothetical protein
MYLSVVFDVFKLKLMVLFVIEGSLFEREFDTEEFCLLVCLSQQSLEYFWIHLRLILMLVLDRSKHSLSKSVSWISEIFVRICLYLNDDKCEYLSFGSSPFLYKHSFALSFQWLDINITTNLTSFPISAGFRSQAEATDRLLEDCW